MNKHLTAAERHHKQMSTVRKHTNRLFPSFFLVFTAAVVDSQNMRVRGIMGTLISNSTIAKAAPAPLRM